MLQYGYIKILTGINKGRIGRYVRNDNHKAVVSFNYQIDIIPYSNYKKFSYSNLTNPFTKQDLIDRYYNILIDLQAIDIRGHRTIKKYSADHIDIITECDLIRCLLYELYSIDNLDILKKDRNVIIFSSFKDILWCNDFVLDLENRKLNVGIINHELWQKNSESLLDNCINKCNNFMFVLSENSKDEYWFYEEYQYLKSVIDEDISCLLCIRIDDSSVPEYVDDYYDLREVFSEEYNENFSNIINEIEI